MRKETREYTYNDLIQMVMALQREIIELNNRYKMPVEFILDEMICLN